MRISLRFLTMLVVCLTISLNAFAGEKSKKPSKEISPVIDGKQTSIFEWMKAGYEDDQDDNSGAMHNPNDIIKALYYGNDNANLFLRVDFYSELVKKLKSDDFICIYLGGSQAQLTNTSTKFSKAGKEATILGFAPRIEILIEFKDVIELGQGTAVLSEAQGENKWTKKGKIGVTLIGTNLVELKIPLAELGLEKESNIKFKVVTGGNGVDKDIVPNGNPIELNIGAK